MQIQKCDAKMSEQELKRFVEDAVYKYVKKQIEEGKYIANLRIEIDHPIEINGMKGRIVGEIMLGRSEPVIQSMPTIAYAPAPAEGEKKEGMHSKQAAEEEMSMQEVERLLKSLGV
jgi:hypothetical protein